jgi:hypothetical protein
MHALHLEHKPRQKNNEDGHSQSIDVPRETPPPTFPFHVLLPCPYFFRSTSRLLARRSSTANVIGYFPSTIAPPPFFPRYCFSLPNLEKDR